MIPPWIPAFFMRIFAMMRGRAAASTAVSTVTTLARASGSTTIPVRAMNAVRVVLPNMRNWPAAVASILRRAISAGTFGYFVYEVLNLFGLFEGQDETAARNRVDAILSASGLDPNAALGSLTEAQMDQALGALERSLGSQSSSASAILNGMRSHSPNMSVRDFLGEQDAVTEFTAHCAAMKRGAELTSLSIAQFRELAVCLETIHGAEPDESIRAVEHLSRFGRV